MKDGIAQTMVLYMFMGVLWSETGHVRVFLAFSNDEWQKGFSRLNASFFLPFLY